MADPMACLARDGFLRLPMDRRTLAWVEAARPVAQAAVADPDLRAQWLRHGDTWFVGVDVLPNDPMGAVAGVPLAGPWEPVLRALAWWPERWHRAQLSVTYPGYPGADPGEPPGAVRFCRERYAAHLDGLLPVGAERRRKLVEPHAFVLGLPLVQADPGAAPLVVWPGSHHLVDRSLGPLLQRHPVARWSEVDLTDAYTACRRQVVARDPVPVILAPGEAVLLHRHLIHGVAPWAPGATAPPEGRMVAYFRPCFSDPARWLDL